MQTFERQVASGLNRCSVPERRSHFAIDENMTVSRLRAKPSREIHDRADRAIVAAALEADRAERRISVSDFIARTKRLASP
jgi:hypothetical protein